MKVQTFCEEKGLISLLGVHVFGYAESKNRCWHLAEKWFSLFNLHISKMATKLKNNGDICKRINI